MIERKIVAIVAQHATNHLCSSCVQVYVFDLTSLCAHLYRRNDQEKEREKSIQKEFNLI